MVVSSSPVPVIKISYFAPVLSKEFIVTQETIECGFTLKLVLDMTGTSNQTTVKISTDNSAQSFFQFH